MKKIAYEYKVDFNILNPKDYIIIEEDNQRISDKYVDFDGKKINEYEDDDALKKGDVVIRGCYYINVWNKDMSACFRKFKYCERYRNDNELYHSISKLKKRYKDEKFCF